MGEQPTMADRYDSQNRLIRRATDQGIVDLIYDGDGNRVGKIVDGEATWYFVDTQNLTGYAQVLEELSGPDSLSALASGEPLTLEVAYTYGLDLISQDRREVDDFGNESWQFRYHTYDGLGSVVALTDATGEVTDRYTYDAFGVELEVLGDTENSYRFTGEQYDDDLALYYLRARYLNPGSGRFWTMDPFEGFATDPISLHKYLYAHAAPNMWVDPSGNFRLPSLAVAVSIIGNRARMAAPAAIQVANRLTIGAVKGYFLAQRGSLIAQTVSAYGLIGLGAAEILNQAAGAWINHTAPLASGPAPRGIALERAAGANLGGNFPVIDDFRDGVGTSIKTHTQNTEKTLLSAIRADLRKMEGIQNRELSGTTSNGVPRILPPGSIKHSQLIVGIPESNVGFFRSASFRSALQAYQRTYNATVTVIPVRNWIIKK